MFVQLRRVVYLLVLLQCCACVAYAQDVKSSAPDFTDYLDVLDNTPDEWNNKMTEEVIVKATSVYSAYLEEVALWENISESIGPVLKELNDLIEIKERKQIKTLSDSQDDDKVKYHEAMKNVAVLLKKSTYSRSMLYFAGQYFNPWVTVLDNVIEYVRQRRATGTSGLSTTGGETAAPTTPQTTYEELILLRDNLTAAIRREGFLIKNVNDQLGPLHVALNKLLEDDSSVAAMFGELMRNIAEPQPLEPYEAKLKRIEARVKAERLDKIQKKEEERGKAEQESTESSTVTQAGEGSPTTEVESPPAPQAPPAPPQTEVPQQTEVPPSITPATPPAETQPVSETSSQPSPGTSITNKNTQQTENTTSTIAPAVAILNEAMKMELRDAANAPISHTAVVAVLALTVSTVAGIAVV